MNSSTLQALRRLLFFSRPEAALLVAASQDRPAGVSDRAWRMWEDGARVVPDDVARNVLALIEWRHAAIGAAVKQICAAPNESSIALVWYESLDEWASLNGREPVLWRAQQSVVSALAGEFSGRVRLIRFDGPAYAEWLGGRADSETLRSIWAAAVNA